MGQLRVRVGICASIATALIAFVVVWNSGAAFSDPNDPVTAPVVYHARQLPEIGGCNVFTDDSFTHMRVDNLPVDPNSTNYTDKISSELVTAQGTPITGQSADPSQRHLSFGVQDGTTGAVTAYRGGFYDPTGLNTAQQQQTMPSPSAQGTQAGSGAWIDSNVTTGTPTMKYFRPAISTSMDTVFDQNGFHYSTSPNSDLYNNRFLANQDALIGPSHHLIGAQSGDEPNSKEGYYPDPSTTSAAGIEYRFEGWPWSPQYDKTVFATTPPQTGTDPVSGQAVPPCRDYEMVGNDATALPPKYDNTTVGSCPSGYTSPLGCWTNGDQPITGQYKSGLAPFPNTSEKAGSPQNSYLATWFDLSNPLANTTTYDPNHYPPQTPTTYLSGSGAGQVAVEADTVRMSEVADVLSGKRDDIGHYIHWSIPHGCSMVNGVGQYQWPARGSDCNDTTNHTTTAPGSAAPRGEWFRLDPSYEPPGIVQPQTQVIIDALKRYGAVVLDSSPLGQDQGLSIESSPKCTTGNPYSRDASGVPNDPITPAEADTGDCWDPLALEQLNAIPIGKMQAVETHGTLSDGTTPWDVRKCPADGTTDPDYWLTTSTTAAPGNDAPDSGGVTVNPVTEPPCAHSTTTTTTTAPSTTSSTPTTTTTAPTTTTTVPPTTTTTTSGRNTINVAAGQDLCPFLQSVPAHTDVIVDGTRSSPSVVATGLCTVVATGRNDVDIRAKAGANPLVRGEIRVYGAVDWTFDNIDQTVASISGSPPSAAAAQRQGALLGFLGGTRVHVTNGEYWFPWGTNQGDNSAIGFSFACNGACDNGTGDYPTATGWTVDSNFIHDNPGCVAVAYCVNGTSQNAGANDLISAIGQYNVPSSATIANNIVANAPNGALISLTGATVAGQGVNHATVTQNTLINDHSSNAQWGSGTSFTGDEITIADSSSGEQITKNTFYDVASSSNDSAMSLDMLRLASGGGANLVSNNSYEALNTGLTPVANNAYGYWGSNYSCPVYWPFSSTGAGINPPTYYLFGCQSPAGAQVTSSGAGNHSVTLPWGQTNTGGPVGTGSTACAPWSQVGTDPDGAPTGTCSQQSTA
jgi:hypothetical protein